MPEAPVSDAEVVEVRTKKVPGKIAKARRVVAPRLPTLAYAMPGRNGKTWQESIVSFNVHIVANVSPNKSSAASNRWVPAWANKLRALASALR